MGADHGLRFAHRERLRRIRARVACVPANVAEKLPHAGGGLVVANHTAFHDPSSWARRSAGVGAS
jgi:hypothetical protein